MGNSENGSKWKFSVQIWSLPGTLNTEHCEQVWNVQKEPFQVPAHFDWRRGWFLCMNKMDQKLVKWS